MERIAQLDQEVAELKSQNTMLGQVNGATSIFPMEIHYLILLQLVTKNHSKLFTFISKIYFEVAFIPVLVQAAHFLSSLSSSY